MNPSSMLSPFDTIESLKAEIASWRKALDEIYRARGFIQGDLIRIETEMREVQNLIEGLEEALVQLERAR